MAAEIRMSSVAANGSNSNKLTMKDFFRKCVARGLAAKASVKNFFRKAPRFLVVVVLACLAAPFVVLGVVAAAAIAVLFACGIYAILPLAATMQRLDLNTLPNGPRRDRSTRRLAEFGIAAGAILLVAVLLAWHFHSQYTLLIASVYASATITYYLVSASVSRLFIIWRWRF